MEKGDANADAGDSREQCPRDRALTRHFDQGGIVKNHIGRQFLPARLFETPRPQRLPNILPDGFEFDRGAFAIRGADAASPASSRSPRRREDPSIIF